MVVCGRLRDGLSRPLVLAAVFAFGGVLLVVSGVEDGQVLIDNGVWLDFRPALWPAIT